MKVDLITETNSDLTVVNAARCSFDKESTWHLYCHNEDHIDGLLPHDKNCDRELCQGDSKLISYLATHNHWTPFAHPQECFELDMFWEELCNFLYRANLSGFEWSHNGEHDFRVRGSLYAWLTNLSHLPEHIAYHINQYLCTEYPVSVDAVTSELIPRAYTNTKVKHISKPTCDELKTYTLRITCPIFIKRQLETHRRNMVITDIEDFAQNEVSRRYVATAPKFYRPEAWYKQDKIKKQGASEEMLTDTDEVLNNVNYSHLLDTVATRYKAMLSRNTAVEQARMILPLSTYTTFWWTGSVKSWKWVLGLRLDSHAQGETQELARLIASVLHLT